MVRCTMNTPGKAFSVRSSMVGPMIRLMVASMIGALSLSATSVAVADENYRSGFSLVANLGVSRIGDQGIVLAGGTPDDGGYRLDNGSDEIGYVGGIGLRYNFGPAWETEIAWEYRKNDGAMTSNDGYTMTDVDYRSSLVFLNQRRYFNTDGDWQPYVGAGLMAIQNLELDYELNGNHRVYQGDGGIGAQLITGLRYHPPDSRLILGFELRYGSVDGEALYSDGGRGAIDNIDYSPLTLQMNIGWR